MMRATVARAHHETVRMTFVGDEKTGKASLLYAYAIEVAPHWTTNVTKTFHSDVTVGNGSIQLILSSTNKVNDVRTLPHADVFVVCFSLDKPQSLIHAENLWIPAIKATFGHIPILVVGMKSDLREMYKKHKSIYLHYAHRKPIKEKAGKNVANNFDEAEYAECSSKKVKEVKRVMEKAATMALSARNSATSSFCSIM
uniref:Rho-related GTP-binding protein n=1 Tax=Steinernema glaseri TaxID=37863 RepID=A0A1I7YM12_9BILA